MYSLYKKEINTFFSSLSGYIVITIFLIINGLFIWVFPGHMNVLDTGYANIDTLFIIAPWVFLFLVPAITMRMFSEEKNSGTLELLLSRPLTDMQIILSKFFAGLTLVLFSIIPTLLYFLSIYLLGDPVGSIDSGGTWGSYIGLFFLAAIYASIGIFSSSLTSNQIIAFLISASLAFFLYLGFDFLASTFVSGEIEYIILQIGINKHYESMSRGVIDSRDIIYFLSTIGIFLFATKAVIQSRNN